MPCRIVGNYLRDSLSHRPINALSHPQYNDNAHLGSRRCWCLKYCFISLDSEITQNILLLDIGTYTALRNYLHFHIMNLLSWIF